MSAARTTRRAQRVLVGGVPPSTHTGPDTPPPRTWLSARPLAA
jgi:hypothetical protein